MTDHYDYRLRITVLTDPGPPPPPESTLRALEAYIGGMLTASGIHGAVTIEPLPPSLALVAPTPRPDE